jgi:hypothetical protein
MAAIILQFPEQESINEGNGALEVVADYLERVHPARVMARAIMDEFETGDALPNPDHFLMWLWDQGFKVVPLEESDYEDGD